jgi:nucleoside-diphosphate-sugar epimerase
MHVLVTGGAGFIGSHVVDHLVEMGHSVGIFERHATDVTPRANVDYFLGDITNREVIWEAVGNSDGVINLAGILGTSETVGTAQNSVDVNILGALNVFDAVKHHGKKAVQITVGNYTWNNAYAITKVASERFALMYNAEFGTKIAVVRGLNVYGPRQKHAPVRKVVPNFILPALLNQPIYVYGDGEQLLDVIYVRDTAEVLVRALLMDHGCYGSVMEAGSGQLVTANQLAKEIIELAGSKSKIEHIPMRPGEPIRSVTKGDPSTLKPLGYVPSTSLRDGLTRTIQWYRSEYLPKLSK